jgi:hypothetical protein
MKLHIVTRDGERLEYEVDPESVGLLEFRVRGQDPDLPARHWLHEIQTLEVSEHPLPAIPAPGEPPPETEWDVSLYGATGSGFELVGEKKIVKRRVAVGTLPKGLREPYPGSRGAPHLPAKVAAKKKAPRA